MLYVSDEMETAQEISCSLVNTSLPPEARAGGHGTAEYDLVHDFLRALRDDGRPPLDEIRAMDLTVPGLIAHESAMQNGVWLDVPSLA